jgi:hypothetical protein
MSIALIVQSDNIWLRLKKMDGQLQPPFPSQKKVFLKMKKGVTGTFFLKRLPITALP